MSKSMTRFLGSTLPLSFSKSTIKTPPLSPFLQQITAHQPFCRKVQKPRRAQQNFIMSSDSRVDRVKVVIINTQYVETDATSFKSVVQRFTGKDSKIEMEPLEGFKDNPIRFQSGVRMSSTSDYKPVMARGMSFKDLDRLLKELPPLEELYKLYAD